ncbi:hypothetical protein GN958_ATG16651 [Phytophthora infestans]|uniref:Uncharacterized protein n=1 Tax=Phytophthora infestans TaxID=4787 RepID=A0A8S9TZU0_PHYIN|nr:hypothetical protein GN958_ATG16651 [Phytophthora infestans]
MIATLKAQQEVKPTSNAQPYSGSRETRQVRTRGIPKDVLRLMPKQGALNLCMKHLAKVGCSGSSDGTSGKCFFTKRAHFRPKTQPEPVKQHIIKNFGGLGRPSSRTCEVNGVPVPQLSSDSSLGPPSTDGRGSEEKSPSKDLRKHGRGSEEKSPSKDLRKHLSENHKKYMETLKRVRDQCRAETELNIAARQSGISMTP